MRSAAEARAFAELAPKRQRIGSFPITIFPTAPPAPPCEYSSQPEKKG